MYFNNNCFLFYDKGTSFFPRILRYYVTVVCSKGSYFDTAGYLQAHTLQDLNMTYQCLSATEDHLILGVSFKDQGHTPLCQNKALVWVPRWYASRDVEIWKINKALVHHLTSRHWSCIKLYTYTKQEHSRSMGVDHWRHVRKETLALKTRPFFKVITYISLFLIKDQCNEQKFLAKAQKSVTDRYIYGQMDRKKRKCIDLNWEMAGKDPCLPVLRVILS